MFRFGLHHFQRGQRRRRLRRGQPGAEDDLPAVGPQIFDHRAIARDEPARARQRLGKTSRDHVHLIAHAMMIRRSPPIAAQHAETVRIVHDDQRAEFFRQLHDARQRGNVALHRIDAIHRDGLRLLPRQRRQIPLQRIEVFMVEPLNCRTAEQRAIPKRGMNALVHQQRVPPMHQRAQSPRAGEIPRGKNMARLPAQKFRQRAFQLLVISAAPVRQPRSARTRTPLCNRVDRRLSHLRVRTQPEIFVAAHHQHAPPLHRDIRALLLVRAVIIGLVFMPQFRREVGGVPFEKGLGAGLGRW